MVLLLIIFGVISGITTVLFGFGGGFVTVPLLASYLLLANHDVALSGYTMQIAVATSAFIMIFSAFLSSVAHYKQGNLVLKNIKTLFFAIAVGRCFGALLASVVDGKWIHWLFVGYLIFTIIDCLVRLGFMHSPEKITTIQSFRPNASIGTIIGVVAAFLGVGGSIITVPLMRRRGASMQESVAMANPLTLPMAITSTLVYVGYSYYENIDLGRGFIGFLYLKGTLILILSAWAGIQLGKCAMQYLPDGMHAKAYPILLIIVLLVMVLVV